jgi:tripartite-type tricarboxylate transporter receptor subunit TctC
VHVPYKGGAPAQQDVIGGRVPILLDVLYAVQPLINSGKIKVIALLSPTRPASAQKLRARHGDGAGRERAQHGGSGAAAGTPHELVQRISSDVARAVKGSDLTERMTQLGMEPVGSSPEAFDALIRAEIEKWARVVKALGREKPMILTSALRAWPGRLSACRRRCRPIP